MGAMIKLPEFQMLLFLLELIIKYRWMPFALVGIAGDTQPCVAARPTLGIAIWFFALAVPCRSCIDATEGRLRCYQVVQ